MTKTKIFIIFSVCILFLIITPVSGKTFESLIFRINAGVGTTIIDLPTALERDERYFEDWDKLNVRVNIQCEFLDFSSFRLGVEVGYNRLYYYYIRIPWVPSPLIRERTIIPKNISAFGSYMLNDKTFVQVGIGPYIYYDGVVMGIKGTLGYRIPVGENTAVPISLFGDVNLGDGTPISFGLTVGFEYKLSLSKSK